jgi:hypothetical protein
MSRPTKLVVDCTTGEQSVVELTDEEIAQREADALAFAEQQAARQAEEAAKEAAKASAKLKLAALGLTEEEVSAFLN